MQEREASPLPRVGADGTPDVSCTGRARGPRRCRGSCPGHTDSTVRGDGCEGTNQGLVLKKAEKPAKLRSGHTGHHTGSGTQERRDNITSAPGMRPAEHTCVSTTSGLCSLTQRHPKMMHSSDPVLFHFPDASPVPRFSSSVEGDGFLPCPHYTCVLSRFTQSALSGRQSTVVALHNPQTVRGSTFSISLAPSHGCPRRHDMPTQGKACTGFYRNVKLKAFS